MLQAITADPPARRHLAALAVVLILAASVRFHAATTAQCLAFDSPAYLHFAQRLTERPDAQTLRDAQYPPGYPAAVAAVARLCRADWPDGWIKAGQFVSIASSLLALAMLYIFARMAFDSKIAVLTVGLFGLSQRFVELSADVLSDPLALGLAMSAIILGLAAERRLLAGRAAVCLLAGGAGLAGGLSYLTRPEGLMGALLAGLLLIRHIRLDRRQRLLQFAALGLLILAAAVCVAPYAATIGSFTQKKAFSDFACSGGSGLVLAQASGAADQLDAFRRVLDRFRASMGTPVFVLAAVSWGSMLLRRVFKIRLPEGDDYLPYPSAFLVAVFTTMTFVILLAALELHNPRYISSRHALLPALLLSPCAGAGLLILARWSAALAGRIRPWANRPTWTLAACGVLFGGILLTGAMRPPHEGKLCYRQAGLAVRDLRNSLGLTSDAARECLAGESLCPFYADAPAKQFADNSYRLYPGNLASVDALADRAAVGSPPYRFIFLSQSFCQQAAATQRKAGQPVIADKPADIVDRLTHDGRFTFIRQWRSSPTDIVWAFLFAPANSTTSRQ